MKEFPSGFLLINKPIGITSFDIIRSLRRLGFPKKMGHAGTLDPFASGLMIIAIGEACKFLRYLNLEPKVYHAKLQLGIRTDTLDCEGNIVEQESIPDLTEESINQVFKNFLGVIEQLPPMYSAKKIKGKKLYELARNGIEIDRKPVSINVFDIDLISFQESMIEFRVACSSGTYIRSLGDDIAKELQTCGHLVELKRISLNQYHLEKANSIDEINENSIIKLNDFLIHIPKLNLSANQYQDIIQGRSIEINIDPSFSENKRQFIYQNQFIGIGELKENTIFPKRLIKLNSYI